MKKSILLFTLLSGAIITIPSCKKKGCIDSTAANYDANAKKDDGSCKYATIWYQDADGDGQGNIFVTMSSVDQPSGYVSNSTDANDVTIDGKQRAVVVYQGATWCPPCGTNGEPAKAHIESTHGSDVALISVQAGDAISGSSDFGPVFGDVFATLAGSTGIPHIFYSSHGYTFSDDGFSSSESTNNSWTDAAINSMLSKTPEAGVGAFASISGNTITVKTKTKFTSATGQRWIGVYLVEDGVMASQSLVTGGPTSLEHNNVLRASATGSTGDLGTVSLGTSFTANQTVEGSYTITANSTWNKDKLQVVVVLWEGNSADKISNGIKVDVVK